MPRWILCGWCLCVLSFVSTVSAQRVCNNPWCAMCARLESQYRHRLAFQQQQQAIPPVRAVRVGHLSPPTATAALDFQPSPQAIVNAGLRLLELQPGDLLIDPGCGDARALIAAARQYGCRGLGIEIDPQIAALARREVRKAGVDKLVYIQVGDSRHVDWDDPDAAWVYLDQDLIAALEPQLKQVDRVASYSHTLPMRGAVRHTVHADNVPQPVYLWHRALDLNRVAH